MNLRIVAASLAVGLAAGLVAVSIYEPAESETMSAPWLEAGGSPVLGNPDAPITMIEWGDYQCTFCYRFHQDTLDDIKRDYVETGALRIIFQDFPLNGPDSMLAAHASRCAADQEKFWQYHDTLYLNWGGERTGWITGQSLYGFALDANLDISEFNECMSSERYMQSTQEGYERAQQAGIGATPSFVIHDGSRAVKITGNQPLEVFVAVLEEFLATQ